MPKIPPPLQGCFPGVSSTWHRCFPPSPIRAPHSLGRKADRTGSTRGCFTDAGNASPTCVCVGQSPPSASALPPNQPHSRSGRAPAGPSLNPHPCSPSLSPCGLCPSQPRPLPSPWPLLQGAWKLISPGSLTAQAHCPEAPRLRPLSLVALLPDLLADSLGPSPASTLSPGLPDFLPPVPSAGAETLEEPVSSPYRCHSLTHVNRAGSSPNS